VSCCSSYNAVSTVYFSCFTTLFLIIYICNATKVWPFHHQACDRSCCLVIVALDYVCIKIIWTLSNPTVTMLMCLMNVWPYQNAQSCVYVYTDAQCFIVTETYNKNWTLNVCVRLHHLVRPLAEVCYRLTCELYMFWGTTLSLLYYTLQPMVMLYTYASKVETTLSVMGWKPELSYMHDFLSQKNYCIKDNLSGILRCVYQSNAKKNTVLCVWSQPFCS
jgi:hypothetical protein